MNLRAPFWWYGPGGPVPTLLSPLSLVWTLGGRLREAMAQPYRSRLPVICIGNPTAGGGGKTPAAIAIAELLFTMRERPVFLTRGHGGTTRGPHLVDAKRDTAVLVGDEPLLLARTAPVVVCGKRDEGARYAETLRATVIVMDDGFQNPSIEKDISFLAIDRASGIGNGRVIPAGPLRAPLARQLERASAVLLTGRDGKVSASVRAAIRPAKRVLSSRLAPGKGAPKLSGKRVVAYAGIAHPKKFFNSLEQGGAKLVAAYPYADHHPFTADEARNLLEAARSHDAVLVTTDKDYLRISDPRLRRATTPVPVKLVLDDRAKMKALLKAALAARRRS